MTPAIECRCGARFETPRPNEATAEEMVKIIETAASHISNNVGFVSTYPHRQNCNLCYEPVTGGPKTHIDFYTKEAITEVPEESEKT